MEGQQVAGSGLHQRYGCGFHKSPVQSGGDEMPCGSWARDSWRHSVKAPFHDVLCHTMTNTIEHQGADTVVRWK